MHAVIRVAPAASPASGSECPKCSRSRMSAVGKRSALPLLDCTRVAKRPPRVTWRPRARRARPAATRAASPFPAAWLQAGHVAFPHAARTRRDSSRSTAARRAGQAAARQTASAGPAWHLRCSSRIPS
eukprot:scaffold7416_cov390-Prasinococcus_capsulatus_cf.AAC.4